MRSTYLRWTFMLVSGAILLMGLSPWLQRKLNEKGLIADQYRYGDLYNKTNLAQFRDLNFKVIDNLDSSYLYPNKVKNVHLFTIGDSFTVIDTAYFAGEKNVHVWITYGSATTKLDSNKKNILVIEVIERLLQQRMKADIWRMYVDDVLPDPEAPKPVIQKQPTSVTPPNWIAFRFGDQINNRLEFMLFNSDLMLYAKELKASILLNWFGRTPGARLSTDKQEIFYDIEVDTTSELSSFRHLSNAAIDTTVHKLNLIHDYYKSIGFDEIYISLIPNKSSVVAPGLGQYNHQIERIEKHPSLKPSVLSVFDTLRKHPDWYHDGDGHWNKYGKQYWLKQVNQLAERHKN